MLPAKISVDEPTIAPVVEEDIVTTKHLMLVEDNLLNAEVFIGIMEGKATP